MTDSDEASRYSRREFIKRVIASGAVASAATYVFGGMQGCSSRGTVASAVAGSVERLIRLNVNGQERPVDVLPQETLAMTLRYRLGLTGTKLSCDRAECGACSVMIDDVVFNSCSTLTHSVRGRKVVTIEGVASPAGELHPVQQAFIDELSPQCGFCTPGQIISAVVAAQAQPESHARRSAPRDGRQPLPLRGLRQLPERRHACRRCDGGRST